MEGTIQKFILKLAENLLVKTHSEADCQQMEVKMCKLEALGNSRHLEILGISVFLWN